MLAQKAYFDPPALDTYLGVNKYDRRNYRYVWDKVLGYFTNGNTDKIGGDVGTWAGWIIMFLVGKGSVELKTLL
jgi:hypothetical protein